MTIEYYVNKHPHENGMHEVHTAQCSFLPDEKNLIPLGVCSSCYEALGKAKEHFKRIDGCYYCCYECSKY